MHQIRTPRPSPYGSRAQSDRSRRWVSSWRAGQLDRTAGYPLNLVGWRPSRTSTHEMAARDRSAPTQRRARDRKRWGGTRNCLSQPPRPVPGDQPWTDPCKNKPAGAARPSLGTPPACPASARSPRCPPRHRLRSRPAPGRRSPTRRADELGFSGRPARPSGCHKVAPAEARTGPTETTEEPQIPPRSTSGPRRTSQQLVTAFPGGVASRDGPSV